MFDLSKNQMKIVASTKEIKMASQTSLSATQMKEKMLYSSAKFFMRMERPYLSLMIGTLKSIAKARSALTFIPAKPTSALL